MKTSKNLGIGLAAVMMMGTSQAANLYWDVNGATAGFGSGGTWGTDAFWTTDSSGGFSDGGTGATASGDVVYINQDNLGGFAMDVTGKVDVLRMVSPSTNTTGGFATINGAGSNIHVHTSGTGTANAVLSGTGDLRMVVNPNLVLEAAAGITVALGDEGGNNSNVTFNGSITSTNTVDLFYADPGRLFLNGAVDLKGGSFLSGAGGTFRPKHHEVGDGVLGSGVHHVDRSGAQGGHNNDKGRLLLGANQAYTGDTFLDTSVIRLLADTSLPATTTVYITGVESDVTNGLMELNFTGINDISGLYFNGVEQAGGTWGAVGNGVSDHESGFFTGTGLLNVVSAGPSTFQLVITPNGANYDFSWDSQDGKLYDLVSSTDLATAILDWLVYDDGVNPIYENIASGGTTTTLSAVAPTGTPRFFAVVEKD